MNKFQNIEEQEKVAKFLCRLSLELRKNSNLVWDDRNKKFWRKAS